MKKKKTTDKHYFARICRVLGRFSMCIGAITAIGLACLGIIQALQPKATVNQSDVSQQQQLSEAISSNIRHSTQSYQDTGSPAAQIGAVLIAIAGVILIALLFWHSLQRYNDSLRKLISQLAKHAHIPIFTVEICLALLFWAFATIIIAQSMPIFSIFTFFALIANEFFFIFAWAAYGRPVYTL